MNKQKFILIFLLLAMINLVLFNYYKNIKTETLNNNKNINQLKTKILHIKYLQNKIKTSININNCKKHYNNNNLILECNIKPNNFRYISRKIFNSNLLINKFIIKNKKDFIYIKVEISK